MIEQAILVNLSPEFGLSTFAAERQERRRIKYALKDKFDQRSQQILSQEELWMQVQCICANEGISLEPFWSRQLRRPTRRIISYKGLGFVLSK